MELAEKVNLLPTRPGVYLMKDAGGKILYVGKAKNLRARVRSYLRPGQDGRVHIRFLMDRTADLDWVVTGSEKEALLLENTLIKKHRPRYNIDLKDDKTYLSLRLDVRQDFPRIELVRQVKKDGARYLGPYSSARDLRATVDLILKIFPLRSCSDSDFKSRTRPCLYHWTRGCRAPCTGLIDKESYGRMVKEVELFLSGKNSLLAGKLKKEMGEAAAREAFEEAALLRDRLKAVEATLERQKTVSHTLSDRDAIAWVREGSEVEACVLIVRGGAIIDQRGYYLPNVLEEDEEFAAEFLRSYYSGERIVPDEVLVQALPSDEEETLAQWLGELRGKKVRLFSGARGERAELLGFARENAAALLSERRKTKAGFEAALLELQKRLSLPAPPARIECFDVSNIQGTSTVVGMVSFQNGQPDKAGYRRFKIRTVEGSDDFSSLYEALSRRLARRGEAGWELPDLIVIDGGRGQLSSALKALEDSGAEAVPMVGLAKARTLKGGEEPSKSSERVFMPGRMNPLIMPNNSSALFILQRVRDEAHRYAITFHRKTRSKATVKSGLEDIPGLGAKRIRALLKYFGSVKAMRAASADELAALPGMPEKLARAVAAHLAKG